MSHPEAPLDRLAFFQEKLGLAADELVVLEPYREAFLEHRDEFAQYLKALLLDIPETRRIVELMEPRGGLDRNWRCWYEGLFTERFSERFSRFLWTSGMRHLDRNVDQRFIHLGYCAARRFLGEIVERRVSPDERSRVRGVLDSMLDQCLLVATDAFVAGTTRCEREVIDGIAHQLRNPLTVLGGFTRKIRRKVPLGDPIQPVLEVMLEEVRRVESMVDNVGVYIETAQREARVVSCTLREVLGAALGRLRKEGWDTAVEVPPEGVFDRPLDSDPDLLGILFYQLLRNALEAAKTATPPIVRVAGRLQEGPPPFVTVDLFNNGRTPPVEELEHLFAPFYSSQPRASGFGLPIAALIARKVHGDVDLRVVAGEGTHTLVDLPVWPGRGGETPPA
ncbi:MAG: ATP-binding protein [Deferrisomatales bacterium]